MGDGGIKVANMHGMPFTFNRIGSESTLVAPSRTGPIRHFWLSLITLCASAALALALGLAIVTASAVFAAGRVQGGQLPQDGEQNSQEQAASFSGVITDAHCGAKHTPRLNKSPADCARACVRNGSRYVLVDGDKKYFLTGSDEELEKFAGERVTLFGTLDGDTLNVTSVEAHL